MVEQAVLLAVTGLSLIAGLLVLRHQKNARLAAAMVTFRLDFPRDVEAAAVVAFLRRLAGLLPSWHRRLLGGPVVVFEVRASAERIAHYLSLPVGREDFVLGQLHSALPGVRAARQPSYRLARPTLARELRLTAMDRPLRTEPTASIVAGILASLQPLRAAEQAVMQWLITPAPPPAPAGSAFRPDFDTVHVKPQVRGHALRPFVPTSP